MHQVPDISVVQKGNLDQAIVRELNMLSRHEQQGRHGTLHAHVKEECFRHPDPYRASCCLNALC
jgi:hypothetical protein